MGTDIENTELKDEFSEADCPHQTGFNWQYSAVQTGSIYMDWSYAGSNMTINEV